MDPEEAAIFLTVILKGLTEMRPDLRKALEYRSISQKRFFSDVANYVHRMIKNTV